MKAISFRVARVFRGATSAFEIDLGIPRTERYKPAMPSARSNPEFLNGVPELLLLKLLDRQPMHGYELVRAIEKATSQSLEFGEGCIYPILHRLEQQGSLTSRREVVGSRTRLVYQVTAAGRTKLVASISSWQRVVAAVNSVLEGDPGGHPAVA